MIKRFKELGILGMNSRVHLFMNRFNERKDYPKVDDKVLTAELAKQSGISTPKIYAVFDSQSSLKNFYNNIEEYKSFVLKPAKGSQGNGIVVISKQNDSFVKPDSTPLSHISLKYHASQIISGMYSLNNLPDKAILQERIDPHSVFKKFKPKGLPDIRIIVFKGKPIMAMLRVPTDESDGRANLHQGALGIGIDMETGKTTKAIHHNKLIEIFPQTGRKIEGIQVPYWKKILKISSSTFQITGLGYLGADIVIADQGPMLLELNARPGLSIQLANQKGLLKLLK